MDYPKSLPDVALHGGKFSDGTPDGTIPPSRDPAKWANDVTDEIIEVITDAGLVADEADVTQLRQAIDIKIAAAVAGIDIPETDLTGYARLDTAQSWPATQSGSEVALTDAVTVAWDLAVAQEASLMLGGNRLMGAPTNLIGGTYYSLLVIQPAAGGPFTLAFSSTFTGVSGLVFSMDSDAVDHLVFRAQAGKLRLVAFAKNVSAP